MPLIVETPDTRIPERDYILGVILGEFLGLEFIRVSVDCTDVRITHSEMPGRELHLPDVLLSTADSRWLMERSLPSQPLVIWDSQEIGLDINVIAPELPVIYGDDKPQANLEKGCVRIPIDIFGSAFFMLTRYEEVIKNDRDEHDRFPAWASLAYQEKFLERPIVDEYVELLWSVIKQLWPHAERKQRIASIRVSHDVDRPSRYTFGTFRRFVRSVAGDIVKRRQFSSIIWGAQARYGTPHCLHPNDPFNTFEWLMDVSDKNNMRSAFYFIAGKTYPPHDPLYNLDDPAIRKLIRDIGKRGHEVGLHPSYNTYQNPELLARQAAYLRRVAAEEGVEQIVWGGRMHYLQWRTEVTPNAWERAGMAYDSTLGFADYAGFRSGTSHDYRWFDLRARRELILIERPLIAMEATVISKKYMGVADPELAIEYFQMLGERCQRFGGSFSMLWHNSELYDNKNRELYQKIVEKF
ncbi:polysaccharide deacetylase family protein [Halomonas faecis]|uniref:polysaccharide deacetylase family protein n=1 Tax=Halomonas faecis TaxID=1562110 RepID=UPI0013D2F2F9|nr:polysaccharide deacetylase family protein [Halomonas faecis]